MSLIRGARARSVLDSRGRPTIEVEVATITAVGRAIAPAGASTGRFEARERRDADGLGVDDACREFNSVVAPRLIGRDGRDQRAIDAMLIELDGTEDRSRIGGNTLIATSMAVLHAVAGSRAEDLWQMLATEAGAPNSRLRLPMPEIQILGGGAHAHGRIDLQDLMIVPVGAPNWPVALQWGASVYRAAATLLEAQGRLRGVADEGGFFPDLDGNVAALELVTAAIEQAGHRPGADIVISIDVAASQFYRGERYRLRADGDDLEPDAWIERLADWCRRFPIALVEDPCAEQAIDHWAGFRRAETRCCTVGDDLVVTNAARIRDAASRRLIDAALIKPNQAGTVSEAKSALDACRNSATTPIVSARSGETEDVTIVHLAVGWEAPMLKVGSITRGERTAKWNEGIRISEALGHPPLAASDWLSTRP